MSDPADTKARGRLPAKSLNLLDAFREMYAEVTNGVRALARPDAPTADAIKHKLMAVLARQAADARVELSDPEILELNEAQYVMVAMADEVLIEHAWSGRDAWADHPLEAERPFGTHVAGERIFQRLDELLGGRAGVSPALMGVYLTALGLGFRGRYRFDPSSPEPERYRRELVRHLGRVHPSAVMPEPEVCPAAMEHLRTKEPRRGLRGLREGMLPLLVAVMTMLFVGHALWYYRTIAVREQLDRIEDARAALELRAKQRDKAKLPGEEVSVR